jgi:hypothetical protein
MINLHNVTSSQAHNDTICCVQTSANYPFFKGTNPGIKFPTSRVSAMNAHAVLSNKIQHCTVEGISSSPVCSSSDTSVALRLTKNKADG